MKSTPQELFFSLEGSITPLQREFFAHVMAVIREQTTQIERTDAMIQRTLSANYRAELRHWTPFPESDGSAPSKSLPKPVRI